MKPKLLTFLLLSLMAILTFWNTYIWFSIPNRINEQKSLRSEHLDSLKAVKADSLSKQRLDFVIEELKSYRSFIESERKAHMEFITRVYGLGGALAAAVIALLGYFGFKSLDDVEKRANSTFREKLDDVLSKKLSEQTDFAETLAEVVRREGLWKGRKVLFVGEFETSHKEDIEEFFKSKKVNPVFKNRNSFREEDFNSFDAIIVDFKPEGKEEIEKNGKKETVEFDSFLRDWGPKMPENTRTPFIVYIESKKGRIDETTLSRFKYPYFTPANNRISLFANIFDAFQLAAIKTEKSVSSGA